MDFIKVDFTDRELIPRVVEIIFEEVKIAIFRCKLAVNGGACGGAQSNPSWNLTNGGVMW